MRFPRQLAALAVLVILAVTGTPPLAESLESICGDTTEPTLPSTFIEIFEAGPARSGGTVSLAEGGDVLQSRFLPAGEMATHVLTYRLAPLTDLQGGIALRFRASGWDQIGYLAYGWVDGTGEYWHVKAKNPKQGEWLLESVVPGTISFALSNQWESPPDRHIQSVKLFMKGVPSAEGASIELDRLELLGSQANELDFALAVDGQTCPFSALQSWWPRVRLDSAKDIVRSTIRDHERAQRPSFLDDADFFLKTGNVILDGLPAVHWDIRSALPRDLSDYTTSRFRWHALDPAQAMILAFEATNDHKYLYAARGFVNDWLDDNFYERSTDVRFAWYDHGTALRLLTLLRFWDVGLQESFDARLMGRLLDAIWQHGELLASEGFYVRNQSMRHHNHAIFQDVALLLVHEFVPNLLDAREWQSVAMSRLREQFDALVSMEGDYGVNKENSAGYHDAMLSNCEFVNELLTINKRPGLVRAICTKLRRFSEYVSYPDGRMPSYGDTFRSPAGKAFDGAILVDASEPSLIALKRSGYVILRDRAARSETLYQLVLFASSQTTIHKHKDNLSFTFWADGIEWLMDPGFHSYDFDNPLATYARGPAAHNALVVPDLEYSIEPGLATVGATAPRLVAGSPFHVEGKHRSYPELVVKREIAGEFGSGRLWVRDQVLGENRPATGHLMLHLGEAVEAHIDKEQIRLVTPFSTRHLIVYPPKRSECKSFSAVNDGTSVLGWSFPGFARAVPTTTIRCEVHLNQPIEWGLELRSN